MPANAAAKLYTPDLLSLATELAHYPLAGEWQREFEVRSRTCGSALRLAVNLDENGAIGDFGLSVSACAVGQAAAAIFARHAPNLTFEQATVALTQIEGWLSQREEARPEWPGIDALNAARAHPGRHGAILLPWKAAIEALSKAGDTR